MSWTQIPSTKMKVARLKLRGGYIKQQLVQAATLGETELTNNITTLSARGGICFNLPVDAFGIQFGGHKRNERNTPKQQSHDGQGATTSTSGGRNRKSSVSRMGSGSIEKEYRAKGESKMPNRNQQSECQKE